MFPGQWGAQAVHWLPRVPRLLRCVVPDVLVLLLLLLLLLLLVSSPALTPPDSLCEAHEGCGIPEIITINVI